MNQNIAGYDVRVPTGLLIDGRWREAQDGAQVTVVDPATAKPLAEVASGGRADAHAAVDAAAAAGPGWAATAPRERSEILRRSFDLMIERRDELARLIVAENGKTLADARGEISYAAEFLRWYAEEAVRVAGQWQTAPSGASRILVTRQPIGVALLITPWNFPAAMATRKVGPALAAGCTVVLKPATATPLTALALGALLQEAGVPGGVVNVLPSARAAAVTPVMLRHRAVRKVSFTGSTEVGRTLLAQASERVLSCSMELGGNAPLVDAGAVGKVNELVGEAVDRGATLATGGPLHDRDGYFYSPTVLTAVRPGSRILGEEIFGPVAPIVVFDDVEEAVALANDTEYGLVSYLYTEDLREGMRVAEALAAGMIGLNRGVVSDPAAPFGGTKQSGLGREGGHEGLLEYTESKYIATQW
ncbi:aldehyde dehydrogenase family protein [Pseudonocardia sp. RS010]|uniref:aldehyde dehydrogenase family protein n=1 Tax=Pseudonocardia sp. RS010 TaxID=3385979 RepID=UPI0039A328CA